MNMLKLQVLTLEAQKNTKQKIGVAVKKGKFSVTTTKKINGKYKTKELTPYLSFEDVMKELNKLAFS